MSDLELVTLAKGGDQSAFLELHQRHAAGVKAIARNILRTDDVDDVCQEIFVKAFTRIGSFEGNSQFKTWLTSIAKRECIRIQKDSLRPTKGSAYLDPLADVDEFGEEQEARYVPEWRKQFTDADKRVDLPKILSSLDPILPPKSRRVVQAIATRGATIKDIAEESGEPLKTAESRFSRILRLIEKNISPK